MPPACFEITAHYFRVSKMPSMESSRIASKKHELIWGCGFPELKSVGVACVNHI